MAAALNPIDVIRIAGKLKQLRPEKSFPAIVGYDV
jgi:NADPH:quinone reductase-like Zn-dependent oxidoreductase